VARHEAQVVVQVALVLEGLDSAAVVTQPVLCINSYSHSYYFNLSTGDRGVGIIQSVVRFLTIQVIARMVFLSV
jgi:hypothetical protein|tara:strand:+ start:754 stop:975 length:222 start_codon:yes stop_codon:yes gene_type:complete